MIDPEKMVVEVPRHDFDLAVVWPNGQQINLLARYTETALAGYGHLTIELPGLQLAMVMARDQPAVLEKWHPNAPSPFCKADKLITELPDHPTAVLPKAPSTKLNWTRVTIQDVPAQVQVAPYDDVEGFPGGLYVIRYDPTAESWFAYNGDESKPILDNVEKISGYRPGETAYSLTQAKELAQMHYDNSLKLD